MMSGNFHCSPSLRDRSLHVLVLPRVTALFRKVTRPYGGTDISFWHRMGERVDGVGEVDPIPIAAVFRAFPKMVNREQSATSRTFVSSGTRPLWNLAPADGFRPDSRKKLVPFCVNNTRCCRDQFHEWEQAILFLMFRFSVC